MKIKYLLLFFALFGIASCAKESSPSMSNDNTSEGNYSDFSDVIPGWIRIKLSESAMPLRVGAFTRGEAASGNERIDEVAANMGATEIRRVFNDGGKFAERRRSYGLHLWYDIKIDESIPVSRAGRAFAATEGVEIVEPIVKTYLSDHTVTPDISQNMYEAFKPQARLSAAEAAPFNDPELGKQWHYYNDGSMEGAVAGADINVFPLWRQGIAGSPKVIVAVMDGGIQVDHPDLAANMWVNEGEIPGNGIDDDNNGYIDDIYGWNSYSYSGEITPHHHGTHVAGTVAAVNNNGIGVCGVAGGTGNGDGVRLMSCQGYVYLSNGKTGGSMQPDLFTYAADNGAVISQNSWGYNSTGAMPASMVTAIRYFEDNAGVDKSGNQTGPMKGGVLCFAAGNTGNPIVEDPGSLDGLISVTAMDPDYRKSSYSNYGDKAGIFAPGGAGVPQSELATNPRQVYSTSINDGYAYLNGTSMACPHVSGVAALIVSNYGVGKQGFTADECKKILLSSYKPVGQWLNEHYVDKLGVGLIDASLIFQTNPDTAPVKPEVTFIPDHDKITFKLIMPADGNGSSPLKVNVNYAKQSLPGNVTKLTFTNTMLPGLVFEKTLDLIGGTPYVFTITVTDRYGNESEAFNGTATPLDHINRPPTVILIDNILMYGVSASNVKTLDLSQYFTDPDTEYGDYLTYSFNNSAPDYVEVTLDGSVMTFKPVYKGESNLEVTATDSFGEVVSKTFKAKVLDGPEKPNDDPDKKESEPDKAVMSIAPNPIGDVVNIAFTFMFNETGDVVVYDGAGRKIMAAGVTINDSGKGIVEAGSLAPGTYTLICKVAGKEFKTAFVKK